MGRVPRWSVDTDQVPHTAGPAVPPCQCRQTLQARPSWRTIGARAGPPWLGARMIQAAPGASPKKYNTAIRTFENACILEGERYGKQKIFARFGARVRATPTPCRPTCMTHPLIMPFTCTPHLKEHLSPFIHRSSHCIRLLCSFVCFVFCVLCFLVFCVLCFLNNVVMDTKRGDGCVCFL